MGRLKQANGRSKSKPTTTDRSAGRIKGVVDFADRANGEDAFELGDDEVLLDAPRRDGHDDIFDDREEVLALTVDNGEDSDDEEDLPQQEKQPRSKKTKQSSVHEPISKSKVSRLDRPPPVFTQDSESDEEMPKRSKETSDDEQEQGWGGQYHVSRKAASKSRPKNKKDGKVSKARAELDDYMGDSQTAELKEALRIQSAQKALLQDADYGSNSDYGSDVEADNHETQEDDQGEYNGPRFETRDDAVAHLINSKPYLLSLLSDFQMLTEALPGLRENLKQTITSSVADGEAAHPSIGIETLQIEHVEQYLIIAAFYFKLVLQGQADAEVGQEVFAKLVEFREGIQNLEDAGVSLHPDEEEEDPIELSGNGAYEEGSDDSQVVGDFDDFPNMTDKEIEQAWLAQVNGDQKEETDATIASGKRKRDNESDSDGQAKKKKRRSRNRAKEDRPTTLTEQPYLPPSKALLNLSSKQNRTPLQDDFVEGLDPLGNSTDRKKKDLRFHTAQIASTAARRARAVQGRIKEGGGDDDVPYISKESMRREVQRKEAIQAEKAATIRNQREDAQEEANESGEDGYYDLIKQSKAIRLAKKKDEYDEGRLEDRATLAELNETDGPRSVTRAILANKGLTPKRAKANRNPRVKKRENYEKAKKKVASMKSVYKPKEAAVQRQNSGYSGEKSGIGSKVVKSRKLSG